MRLCRSRRGPLHVGFPSGFRCLELRGCKLSAQVIGLRLQRPPIRGFALEQSLQRAQGAHDKLAVPGKRVKALAVLCRRVLRQHVEVVRQRGGPPPSRGNFAIPRHVHSMNVWLFAEAFQTYQLY